MSYHTVWRNRICCSTILNPINMDIKLSDIAHVKSKHRVSFKNISPKKLENLCLYIYNKGIRYHNASSYYYELDDTFLDLGELDNLIGKWLEEDLIIGDEYRNTICNRDVVNAFFRDSIPYRSPIVRRVLTTGQIGYIKENRRTVLEQKNNEIAFLREMNNSKGERILELEKELIDCKKRIK